jgi:HAD superfamily hydrolase (TIGR01549 family)
VLEAVINAPYLPGVMETLIELQSLKIPAYIVSGTPEDEIKYIVQRRDLSLFFNGVYGTPRKKNEIVDLILRMEQYLPPKCLFIGDSLTDYDAARNHELCFLGIVMDSQNSPFPAGTWTSPMVTVNRL